jgi:hypothetical protein
MKEDGLIERHDEDDNQSLFTNFVNVPNDEKFC